MNEQKKGKKATPSRYEVQINITAHEDIADTYLEMIYGTFVISNLIISRSGACIASHEDSHVQIVERFVLRKPPLASLGISDIPSCEELGRE